jgi:hypothetical protein
MSEVVDPSGYVRGVRWWGLDKYQFIDPQILEGLNRVRIGITHGHRHGEIGAVTAVVAAEPVQ